LLCCNRRKAVPGEEVPTLSRRLLAFHRQPDIFPAGPAIITGALPAPTPPRFAPPRKQRFGTGPTLVQTRVTRRGRFLETEWPPPTPGSSRLIAQPRLIPGPTLALIRGFQLIARLRCVLKLSVIISGASWRSRVETGAGIAIIIGGVTGAVGGTTPG
jgi:hypothetical protein